MAQLKRTYSEDPLERLRKQIKELIQQNYKSVDEFCLLEDFHKSTMSRFLNPPKGQIRTEYQIFTLYKLAKVFKKKLVIELR
jgi:hypothetical protein